jgi:4-hydroxyproline epimerase
MAERAARFRESWDGFRRGLVFEPRGSEAVVGALLLPPDLPGSFAGVLFFDRAGPLGMCGHGTIGVVATLAHLGRIRPGPLSLDTPVGSVRAELHGNGEVSFENVPCWRSRNDVRVRLDGGEEVVGDVAWGGNWFYVVNPSPRPVEMKGIDELTAFTRQVRATLRRDHVTGDAGEPIEHILLNGPSSTPGASARNFVLCPSNTYDRSPCGTGTSAQLAVLHSREQIAPGAIWRQESISGSTFDGSIQLRGGQVYPTIRGSAFVTATAELYFDARDPFGEGLPT